MENVLNKVETLKVIASIGKRSKTMRADIQNAAISSMCHAMDHGDLTLASKLVNAVSASNGTQVRKYMGAFMPVRWVKGKGFVKIKGKSGYTVVDAIDTFWDEYENGETPESAYNAMSDIKSLVKAIEARISKAESADDVAMLAVYNNLLAIASA